MISFHLDCDVDGWCFCVVFLCLISLKLNIYSDSHLYNCFASYCTTVRLATRIGPGPRSVSHAVTSLAKRKR